MNVSLTYGNFNMLVGLSLEDERLKPLMAVALTEEEAVKAVRQWLDKNGLEYNDTELTEAVGRLFSGEYTASIRVEPYQGPWLAFNGSAEVGLIFAIVTDNGEVKESLTVTRMEDLEGETTRLLERLGYTYDREELREAIEAILEGGKPWALRLK